MNLLPFVSALLLALASASASAQSPDAKASEPPEKAKAEDRLPKQELTGQILYQFLLAEIAAQRGQFGLSAGAYLDLAMSTRDPRIVRRAAEIAFHARQYDSALEASRLWLSLEPESQQARQMLSTLLLASGRIEELAGSLARDLAAEGPRIGDALIQLMRAFARYPDKLAVQRLFDQLTQPYLDRAEAHLVRAQTAVGAGDAVRARAEIGKALELRPTWELAALFKAELLPKGAQLDFLKTWLEANPDAQDVRLGYARGLVSEKRYEASRVEFRRLLSANPNNPDILYAVGILSLQVNDAAEAEQQLKRFVEVGRGDLDPARFYLGQIADQAGRPEEALRWYDLVAAGEHLMPAKVRAAQVLLRQNKLDEARERLAAARADAPPGDVRLVVAESQLLRDAGRHADAFAFLVQMLEVQPDQPELLYETALAAEKLGYVDVMERHLRRLMALKPDSAQAYNALGYSLADRNLRLDEAAQLIDKALSLTPDDPFILDSKGWLLFRQGNSAAALEALQKAYAQKPDAEIAAHIGEVLWALGRSGEALAVWREATKAHPTNEVLAATIKRFVP